MVYQRVKGGEKNLKSGIRWTKSEIEEVYHLYKRINGVGLHEHNPEIQKLAAKLGRTVRSTEAQTLMFRALEREGDYSHGNMNKLSRKVWFENEKIESTNLIHEEEKEETGRIPSYREWNKMLIQSFFNNEQAEQEIPCFPISEELFSEITGFEYSIEDFYNSIKKSIGSSNFFDKLKYYYLESLPKDFNGKKVRKPIPEYFGFLIFLIHSLTEDNTDNLTVANVYDRINHYGGKILDNKWTPLNTSISRDLLEPIWEHLEEWSSKFKKGDWGFFKRRDPKNKNRKYVSRIERHALFNFRQFTSIIDSLISRGYRPDSILTKEDWINFFAETNQFKSGTILEYISDESSLQDSVIAFLNSYLKTHYTEKTIGSEKSQYRNPPINLSLCIKSIPDWPKDPINHIYFRAISDNLNNESVKSDNGETYDIITEDHKISNPINLKVDLNKGLLIRGNKNRYSTRKGIFWLSKNHMLNEWMETNQPSNEGVFMIVVNAELGNKYINEQNLLCDSFPILNTDFIGLLFKSLNEEQFNIVYNLYNPYSKIEGKIEVLSNFSLERRTVFFKEFPPKFKYISSSIASSLVAYDATTKEKVVELESLDESNDLFQLPENFSFGGKIQIREPKSQIKTRYNLRITSTEVPPINIYAPELKNSFGRNDTSLKKSDSDIFDIPRSFNKVYDNTKFNSWHANLFSLFSPKAGDQKPTLKSDYIKTKGDSLLQFLAANKSITTYDLPKLIQDLNIGISAKYSKRLMDYWRHLGYINFQDYGEQIRVNPPSIFFLHSLEGYKALVSGYRNLDLIKSLEQVCSELKISISYDKHDANYGDVLPTKIILYDADKQLNKFLAIGERLNFYFVNNIDNPYNSEYVVYQLACFYTQKSVSEFKQELQNGQFYENSEGRIKDHRRKRIYNLDKLCWEDSIEEIDQLPENSIIRYEGFRDRSMLHVMKVGNKSVILNDLSLSIFSGVSKNIILKKAMTSDNENFTLYVPLFIGLPFWIERGLILLNGEVPVLVKNNGKNYRIYNKVHIKIIEVIERKLNLKIVDL